MHFNFPELGQTYFSVCSPQLPNYSKLWHARIFQRWAENLPDAGIGAHIAQVERASFKLLQDQNGLVLCAGSGYFLVATCAPFPGVGLNFAEGNSPLLILPGVFAHWLFACSGTAHSWDSDSRSLGTSGWCHGLGAVDPPRFHPIQSYQDRSMALWECVSSPVPRHASA